MRPIPPKSSLALSLEEFVDHVEGEPPGSGYGDHQQAGEEELEHGVQCTGLGIGVEHLSQGGQDVGSSRLTRGADDLRAELVQEDDGRRGFNGPGPGQFEMIVGIDLDYLDPVHRSHQIVDRTPQRASCRPTRLAEGAGELDDRRGRSQSAS